MLVISACIATSLTYLRNNNYPAIPYSSEESNPSDDIPKNADQISTRTIREPVLTEESSLETILFKVHGFVKAPFGPVPGTYMTITGEDLSFKSYTDDEGYYEFQKLPQGKYWIKAEYFLSDQEKERSIDTYMRIDFSVPGFQINAWLNSPEDIHDVTIIIKSEKKDWRGKWNETFDLKHPNYFQYGYAGNKEDITQFILEKDGFKPVDLTLPIQSSTSDHISLYPITLQVLDESK